MDVEFIVSLVELKRAFRRSSARLPDESEAGGQFVVFNARDNNLEIAASGTSEGLSASVVHPGRASVPFSLFRGIARILRFYPLKIVHLAFTGGVLTVDRTAFEHKDISILPRSISVDHGKIRNKTATTNDPTLAPRSLVRVQPPPPISHTRRRYGSLFEGAFLFLAFTPTARVSAQAVQARWQEFES
jgi:hypothetical protein